MIIIPVLKWHWKYLDWIQSKEKAQLQCLGNKSHFGRDDDHDEDNDDQGVNEEEIDEDYDPNHKLWDTSHEKHQEINRSLF